MSQTKAQLIEGLNINTSAPADALAIDSSGNVGIGTTSPSNILSVDDTQASGGVGIDITNQGDGGSSTTPYVFINAKLNPARPGGEIRFGREGVYGSESTADSFMAFYTAVNSTNTERMRIDSSGNVGIGTTSPTSLGSGFKEVIVSGATEGAGLQLQDTDGNVKAGLFTSDVSGAAFVRTITNHPLAFRTNNTERMRIDSSGNVGIGRTSPAQNLDVASSSNIAYALDGWALAGKGDSSDILFGGILSSQFDTLKLYTGGSERMRIDSSGNVGIGTTSPSSFFAGADQLVVSGGSGDGGITIDSGTSSVGRLLFADGTSGADQYRGYIAYDHANNRLNLGSDGSERLVIDSSGRVGIGTASAAQVLQVHKAASSDSYIHITNTTSGANSSDGTVIGLDQYANMGIWNHENTVLYFATNNTERMRLDSSGRLGLGTSSPGSFDSSADNFVISGTTHTGLTIDATSSTSSSIHFADGSTGNESYRGIIEYQHNNDAFVFRTSAVERARITSSGHLLVAKSTTAFGTAGTLLGSNGTVDHVCSGTIMYLNRLNADGNLIQFYQDSNIEGSISVSGSTVSYNGGHLTRWSQLASGAARTEILRGSVLSNLDEMCEWAHAAQDAVLYTEEDELPEGVSVGDVKTPAVDAYTEDNEQLNRMKISDVEGDPNVAGVFQAWDDDDDTHTNDFYCAMTGDFVIRIAQGTTVARGDLLMSAGDGTAKPQDDDIVRSKTIAKVTSTTVSTTYSDGSYCVPCVLMAC